MKGGWFPAAFFSAPITGAVTGNKVLRAFPDASTELPAEHQGVIVRCRLKKGAILFSVDIEHRF
jgi:hypothetical protein